MLGGEDAAQITQGRPKKSKEPSQEERMVSRAHDAKVNAVDDWANGRISDDEHEMRHKRADKVIKRKGKI